MTLLAPPPTSAPPAAPPIPRDITQLVDVYRRRYNQHLLVGPAIRTALLAVCVLLGWLGAQRQGLTWWWVVVPGCAALVGQAAWEGARTARRWLTLGDATRTLDARLHLKERLVTSLQWAQTSARPRLYETLLADLERQLRDTTTARWLPRRVNAVTYALIVLAIALLAWWLWPTPPVGVEAAGTKDGSGQHESGGGSGAGATGQPGATGGSSGQPSGGGGGGQGHGVAEGRAGQETGDKGQGAGNQQGASPGGGVGQQQGSSTSNTGGGSSSATQPSGVTNTAGSSGQGAQQQPAGAQQQPAGAQQQSAGAQGRGATEGRAGAGAGNEKHGEGNQTGEQQSRSSDGRDGTSPSSGAAGQQKPQGAQPQSSASPNTGQASGNSAGTQQLEGDVKQLLQQLSKQLDQLKAQPPMPEAQGAAPGTNTDEQVFGQAEAPLPPPTSEPVPLELQGDTTAASAPSRKAMAPGRSDGGEAEYGARANVGVDGRATLAGQQAPEASTSRRYIPGEYQQVIDQLHR